jgi:hypothetical protein
MFMPPIQVPVRASEASELADLIFEFAETRRLTEDLRSRMHGRISSLKLETIVAHTGSLCADPVHSSAFFIAIDGVRDGVSKPWLLRVADANTPASAHFPKAILIGRMRLKNRREIVASVVPFGPEDSAHVRTFADEVDRAFLPRTQGTSPSMAAHANDQPFAAFRHIHKSGGLNWAATWGSRDAAIWAAIRAGWREGYSAESEPLEIDATEASESAILLEPGYTKFVLEAGERAGNPAACAEAIGGLCDFIQRARSPQPSWRRFDLEISFAAAAAPTTAGAIDRLLAGLKEQGRTVQSVLPQIGGDPVEELNAAIKRYGAVLKVDVSASTPIGLLREIGGVAGGRVQCRLARGVDMQTVADALRV